MATPPTPLPRISPEAPGATPARKQNTLVWVLSGCGTILVLGLIVGVIGLRSFMKNHVHIGANGEVDVQVAGMTMHAGKAKDLGIPIYSGADLAHATGVDMTIPAKDREPLSMSVSVYATTDSVQKVDDWYHQNLSPDFIRVDPSKNQTVIGSKGFPIPIDRGAIAYSCQRDDIMYLVSINSTLGKTQIKLARTNPPSAKPQ
jgi:hypothetical protein